MNTLKQHILQKIKVGEIAMRPRWRFVFESVLLLIGVMMSTLVVIYAFSLLLFILERTDAIYMPYFGLEGVISFLYSIPWTLFWLGIIFVIILELLVRRYSFAYRVPLLNTICATVLLSMLGTYVATKTAFHDRFNVSRMPIISGVYQGYSSQPPRDLYVGPVVTVSGETLVLDERRRGLVTVMIKGHSLTSGDTIMVFGRPDNDNVIIAKQVRILPTSSRGETDWAVPLGDR